MSQVRQDIETRSLRYIEEGLPEHTVSPSVNIPAELNNRAEDIIRARTDPLSDVDDEDRLPGQFSKSHIMRSGLELWVELWEAYLEDQQASSTSD